MHRYKHTLTRMPSDLEMNGETNAVQPETEILKWEREEAGLDFSLGLMPAAVNSQKASQRLATAEGVAIMVRTPPKQASA